MPFIKNGGLFIPTAKPYKLGDEVFMLLNPGQTSKNVSVTVNGDTKAEGDESFVVALCNPTNATLGDAQGSGTINNDDTVPSLTVNDVTQNEGNNGTTAFVFTVSLSAASGQSVTVQYAAQNGSATVGTVYANSRW